MTETPETGGSPGNVRQGHSGAAWTSIVLATVCCICVGTVLVDSLRAEQGMPEIAALDAVAGFLFVTLRLPLLGAASVAAGLGVVGLVGRRRQAGLRARRILAAAGVILGLTAMLMFARTWGLLCDLDTRSMARADLSGVGRALQMYAQEHEGHYPPDLQAVLANPNIAPEMLRCHKHYDDQASICYTYIPGETRADDPGNALFYGKPGCLSEDAAYVLFVDNHVEWIQPYSRVLELVNQTRQRLAARSAQSAPTSARATAAVSPAAN